MCGGEERSFMWMVYVFPSQHSSQTAVFIQNWRRERKEKKDSVLGMTSFHLVCSTSPTVGSRMAGKVAEAGGYARYKYVQYSSFIHACVY